MSSLWITHKDFTKNRGLILKQPLLLLSSPQQPYALSHNPSLIPEPEAPLPTTVLDKIYYCICSDLENGLVFQYVIRHLNVSYVYYISMNENLIMNNDILYFYLNYCNLNCKSCFKVN